jgi:hypothetical protein
MTKSKRNLAEELTETWVNFRYKDPYEIYQKAVKVTEECEHMIKLCKWAKELTNNLKKKAEELKNPQK